MRASYPLAAFFLGAVPIFVWIVAAGVSQTELPEPSDPQDVDADAPWLAIFGGTEPSAMPISLAQDSDLLREALGHRGGLLFGGGDRALLQRTQLRPETLRAKLGWFFDPRDREVTYVPGPRALAPASLDEALRALDGIGGGTDPLLLYFGGHGDGGEVPEDSVLTLWGGALLGVRDLARVLDAYERPTQVVVTSCFGGGFAELAFLEGDPRRGPTHVPRCGVFATSWDELSSGCDPNPERATQESYSIHFLSALRGKDRGGHAFEADESGHFEIDYDRNGEVGLLDAHTYARIMGRSIDVPTTTSERWLAHVALDLEIEAFAESDTPALPEETAVIEALQQELALRSEEEAHRTHAEAQIALADEEGAIETLEEAVDEAWYTLRIQLLTSWPMLDDPFHPEFEATIGRDGAAIEAVLEHSLPAQAHRRALDDLNEAGAQFDRTRVRTARLRRLIEAHDAVAVARALRAADPSGWSTFEALRACERRVPPR